MAFTATANLIVRTDGSDTANGGGFNPGNASMATDLAATLGNTTAPVVTSASYTFVAGDVGHYVFIQAGTNWRLGWYLIVSVAGGAATLDATPANVTRFDGIQASRLAIANGVASVASPTGGTWSVDYSRGAAPVYSYTDMAASTTTFTSAAHPVGKNIIGNFISITGGTNYTVQRVEIVSTSGTTATVDKTLGASAAGGGAGGLGGAFKTPGGAMTIHLQGIDIFIKSGTYTLSSTTANIAGGRIDQSGVASNVISNPNVIEGYSTIPKDLGTRPTISAGTVGNVTVITLSALARFSYVRNVIVDGNLTGTAVIGIDVQLCNAFICKIINVKGIGLSGNTAGAMIHTCEVTGCTTTAGFFGSGTFVGCESHGNTCHGFSLGTGTCINCLSYANSGSSQGFNVAGSSVSIFVGCVAFNNGLSGFSSVGIVIICLNCISAGHAAAGPTNGWGFTSTVATALYIIKNCAGYGNTAGNVNTTNILIPAESFVAGTTSFFIDAANGNFGLNLSATGGALVRGEGFPQVYPAGTTSSSPDIGASQHPDFDTAGTGMSMAMMGLVAAMAESDELDGDDER